MKHQKSRKSDFHTPCLIKFFRDMTLPIQSKFICNSLKYDSFCCKFWTIMEIHFRLGQISTPTFYPRETRHVSSNLLLSAGILAQYKTFHVSFKQYLQFLKVFQSFENSHFQPIFGQFQDHILILAIQSEPKINFHYFGSQGGYSLSF